MKEAANAQPLLAVKCDVFAVGVAGVSFNALCHWLAIQKDTVSL